jgi:hypothetical protein
LAASDAAKRRRLSHPRADANRRLATRWQGLTESRVRRQRTHIDAGTDAGATAIDAPIDAGADTPGLQAIQALI